MEITFYNGYYHFKNKFWEDFQTANMENGLSLLKYCNILISKYRDFLKQYDVNNYEQLDPEYVKFIIDGSKITDEKINLRGGRSNPELIHFSFLKFLTRRELENIIEFLSLTAENEKSKLRNNPLITNISRETPELDFSDNEDKEKVIMLEKLGIIDYIKSIQQKPETKTHTAEILSAITGINSGTLYSYLLPMLQPNRDDNNKNSPYKNPDNVLQANKTLQKLKIKPDFKPDADL